MSDFDIARENMVHNQLMANNVVEEHILEAFRLIPKEIFLPFEKKPKAYIDEDIKIMNDRYLIEPRVMANIIKLSGNIISNLEVVVILSNINMEIRHQVQEVK